MSSDSIDQLGQVDRFDFFNFHPIAHTFSMWVVTRVWDHPGAVTLAPGSSARRSSGAVGTPSHPDRSAVVADGCGCMDHGVAPHGGGDHDHGLEGRPILARHGLGVCRARCPRPGPGRLLDVVVGSAPSRHRSWLDVGAASEREDHRRHHRDCFGDRIRNAAGAVCWQQPVRWSPSGWSSRRFSSPCCRSTPPQSNLPTCSCPMLPRCS